MNLVVDPRATRLRNKAQRGERILWLESLSWLFCFGQKFDGHMDHVTWRPCAGMFDVGHQIQFVRSQPKEHLGDVIGIKFCCLSSQLERRNTLLALQDEAGNIPALAILEDIVEWCRENSPFPPDRNDELIASARAFLRQENILVPHYKWREALPKENH